MSCGQQFLVFQIWIYAGMFFLVFGDWLVRVARLVYWRQGGWRRAYAGIIPGWSVPTAGIIAIVAATALAANWYQTCRATLAATPSGLVVGILSVAVAVVAIARLIRGRVLAAARGVTRVSGAAVVAEDVTGTHPITWPT